MGTVTETQTETHSIHSLKSRRVEPDEYVSFLVGFTCRRMSDNFTPPDQIDQNRSYVFQEEVPGEKRKHEDEDGETSRPKKQLHANEEKENARLREQQERDEQARSEMSKLRSDIEEQARSEMSKLRSDIEEQARSEMNKLRSDIEEQQARSREELELLRAEQLRINTEVGRLKAYQDAGTCQKLATTALIEFCCNLLSWGLRRSISQDIFKDAKLRQRLLTGRNRPFNSWNEITYKKLQWILYYAWRDEQEILGSVDTILAEYWRQQGYRGTVLWEPSPPRRRRNPASRADQAENLKTIELYLEKAERSLAELLGLPTINSETKNQVTLEEDERSRKRVRILCGLYSTWISGERNEEVHMFGLHFNFWHCDINETEEEEARRFRQEEDLVTLVPENKLRDARVVPKLRSFELQDLQVKLRVLKMVLRDIALLPEFFKLLGEDIALVGALVRKCIGQASGIAILRSQKVALEIPGTNLWLFGDGVVVSSKKPGKKWRITQDGLWLNEDDKSVLDDPSSILLGEE